MSDLTGYQSPVLPAYSVESESDGSYIYSINLPERYSGKSGVVHGGVIACLFDEALGWVANRNSEEWWATANFRADYRAPSPIDQPLRLIVTPAQFDGRKCVVQGKLYSGQTLCAEAEALFVKVR